MAFTPEQQREQVAAWERSLHGDDEASRYLRCVDCGRFAQVHDWPYCGFHASKRAILAFFERDDSRMMTMTMMTISVVAIPYGHRSVSSLALHNAGRPPRAWTCSNL